MAAEPYGTYLVERAYLSRLHAMMVNSGYRGKFDGLESVDRLFALLRRSDVGTQLAEQFYSQARRRRRPDQREFAQNRGQARVPGGPSDGDA